jgi:O-antigen/teichoic acid export membrane protein
MSLAKRAVSSLNWQLITLTCQAIATIVFLMIKSRIISKEAFGIFAIVNVFIALLQMFTEFGFGAALIQRKENKPAHISFAFYSTLVTGIFLYSIIVLAAPFIVSFYENKFETSVVLAVGLNMIILSFGIVSKALIMRDLEFKKLFFVVFISNFLGNIVGIIMALYGYEIWALISINICMNILSVVISFALKPHSIKFIFDITAAKEIFQFGARLSILRLFNHLSNQLDKLIIGKEMSTSVLGIYERSMYLAIMPRVYVGNTLDGVLFSTLSRFQSDLKKVQFIFFRLISLMVLFIGYISLTVFFFSEEVILVVLGNQWIEATTILQILAFLIFFQIFSRFSDTLVRAKNALYKSSIVKFIFLVVTVLGIFIGLPYGIHTVSWMIVLAAVIHSLLMIRLSIRILETNWSSFMKTLIPGLKLMILIGIKNWLMLYFINQYLPGALMILIVNFVVDLIIIFALLMLNKTFFGRENLIFLSSIIENVSYIKPKFKEKFISYIKC